MEKEYISLKEATRYCNYSPDYLKLRARQGKLKAIKMGRNWFTTREWLEEYKIKLESNRAPRKWPVSFKGWLFLFLIIFLITAGIFLLVNFSEPVLEKIIPAKTIEIHRNTIEIHLPSAR